MISRRRVLLALWVCAIAAGLYAFVFQRTVVQQSLASSAGMSALAASMVYLTLGCLRGFTLVPATSLVLIAIPFFSPARLFLLTIAGILVSSACVYLFAEAWHLDEVIRRKHARELDRVHALLSRHGLPIIIGWSFFPLTPTDLICYVCGVLRVRLATCLVGVTLGEGAICAIYIFAGDWLLRLFELKV